MDGQVAWQVELVIKSGALDDFRALTGEMVETTCGEPRVLSYERFISADGTVVHVYERYVDSAAAVAHLRMFERQFGRRFVDLVDRTRFTVYGTPSYGGCSTVSARRTWPRLAVSLARYCPILAHCVVY